MASREMKIGVGLAVLLGLGVAVYYQQKKDASVGRAVATADLPSFTGTDDVDKVDITTARGQVVLEKRGDKWVLTKPVDAPANQTNVKNLTDNLKEIKVTELIAKAPDDALKATYELTPEKSLHLVTSKGGEIKLDATFGKSGGRGNMLMIAGKPDVYATSGYQSFPYSREAKDYRDKEMFKFEDTAVSSMIIANKNGTFDFTKGEKWTGKVKDKPIANLDEEKVKNAVTAFKGLQADDFGDGKAASETGLDAPEATVTIVTKDGTHTLKVGKVSSGTSRYALRDGDQTIFVIQSSPADWATGDLAKFQQPLDGGKTDASATPAMPPGGMGMMPGMQMPPGMHMPAGHP